MKTLDQIARTTGAGGDKDSTRHGYTLHYAKLFDPLRDNPIKFLEIGVEFGLSAKIWMEYFTRAKLFGVDINDHHKTPNDPRYTFVQGDQKDSLFWQRFIKEHGSGWDIIMDDGSHDSPGMITSFNSLWPYVAPGGLYVIEDLMTAYYASMQRSGWPNQMDFIKGLLDDINKQTAYVNTPEPRMFPETARSDRNILWMQFSEELAIIKKK